MRCFASVCALLALCSCSDSSIESGVVHDYEQIENRLIEFKSPAGMLQPDSAQCANTKTLEERMVFYNTPGVSIAVAGNGRVEWAKAYGIMDANVGTPVTTETIFEAASTSKLVTSVMALYFVQQGGIDLDTNVNDYLTTWQVEENEFTEMQKVTLRRLLTHKAGLPTTNYGHQEDTDYPTLLNVLNGELPALNKPAIPELEPGSQWQYSNVAYDVIQLLLEDISGKPFQQIAEELIFEPLGMRRSSFAYPLSPEKQVHEAMPHDAEGVARKPAMHLTALAHGNLTTTPSDLARFVNELLLSYHGASEKILTREMVKQLFTKEFALDPRMFGIPVSEGLGVLLIGEGEDLVFAHPGSNLPGLNCWLIGWPEKSRGIVVMTNGAKGEMLAMEVIAAFGMME
ncbi:serine hydrolase domain-containing protein [Candidatus Eisenbacteria bacterium]|uniref:Serine hydrolase domain-containing protein n=1 Tax=Eiseniibacteriota bacterium TaxID=2212470 RepID=A0ABV6YLB2_UNCEI